MKYYTLIIIILATVFSSCEKDKLPQRETLCAQQIDYNYHNDYKADSICSSDLCTNYFSIWKELIMEKNELSQAYFDTHIEISNSEIHSWADGVSFNVCYKFKIGWATAYNCDSFVVKINKDNDLYPSVNLPRGTYLTKEDIKIAVDHRAFNSGIIKINNEENLQYSKMESALKNLIDYANVTQLCLTQITINEDNGNLVMEAAAKYEDKENACIIGTVDLLTGEKNVYDGPCLISF